MDYATKERSENFSYYRRHHIYQSRSRSRHRSAKSHKIMNKNYDHHHHHQHHHSNAFAQSHHFTSNFEKGNKSNRSQSEFGISRHPSLKLFNMHSKGKRNCAQSGKTETSHLDSAHLTRGMNEISELCKSSREENQVNETYFGIDSKTKQSGGQSEASQSSEEGYSDLRPDNRIQNCVPVNVRNQAPGSSASSSSMHEQNLNARKQNVTLDQPTASKVRSLNTDVNEYKQGCDISVRISPHCTNNENTYEDISIDDHALGNSISCDANLQEQKLGLNHEEKFTSQMNDLVINTTDFSDLERENAVLSQGTPEQHSFADNEIGPLSHEIPFLTEESRESFSKSLANSGNGLTNPDLGRNDFPQIRTDSGIQDTFSVKARIAEFEDQSMANTRTQDIKSSSAIESATTDANSIDRNLISKSHFSTSENTTNTQTHLKAQECITENENVQFTNSQNHHQIMESSYKHSSNGKTPTIIVTDLEPAIIIDNGSGYCKAGFAGENGPRINIPSIVGKPRFKNVIIGYRERDKYIGEHAHRKRGVLALSYPIESGIIINWDDMEALWEHTIFEELGVDPLNHAILMTEAPMNPKQNREEMIEIIFEKFNSPAAYIAIQAILSLYASGRTTGLVLDSGDGVSHSVPVYDGYYFTHAVDRSDTAGRDVTEYLRRILTERGYAFANSAEYEIVKDVKEKMCSVSSNFLHDLHDEETITQLYELPDGSKIEIGHESFRAPECLFRPSLIGTEGIGIHKLLLNSLFSCDIDNRKHLSENIILSGGNVLFPGFTERLHDELEERLQDGIKCAIKRPENCKNLVWNGGSILAGLESFVPFWISKTEYEDEGRHIVHKKCF